jgi:hypothetical protein
MRDQAVGGDPRHHVVSVVDVLATVVAQREGRQSGKRGQVGATTIRHRLEP